MSSNAKSQNRIILTYQAKNILIGQLAIGDAVGLHTHTAATMGAALMRLDGNPAADPGSPENAGSQLWYVNSKNTAKAARRTLINLSKGPVKLWLEGYKQSQQSINSNIPNAGWEEAGFRPGKTAVPTTRPARYRMLVAARAYYALHPAYASSQPQQSGPPLDMSAAAALALITAMDDAQLAISTTKAAQTAAMVPRDADVKGLSTEISGTVAELHFLLSDSDPRWEQFGLNIPANPTPPLGVSGLTLTRKGTSDVLWAWLYAVRAEYYALYCMIVGTDLDFVHLLNVKDLKYLQGSLAPGTVLKAYVVPMNKAGAGPASPTVNFTL